MCRGSNRECSGYAVLRGEKAPDDALARVLGAMGLLTVPTIVPETRQNPEPTPANSLDL